MQMYQKEIYNWNRGRIAEHMNSLKFEYSIDPFASPKNGKKQDFELFHTD